MQSVIVNLEQEPCCRKETARCSVFLSTPKDSLQVPTGISNVFVTQKQCNCRKWR